MRASVQGVKIRGICAIVPANTSRFEDEMKQFPFPEKSSLKLAKVMGFREHRISDPQSTPCDLGSYTLSYLFQKGFLKKADMESLIVVAQMADHPIPGNSKVMHGQLQLPRDVFCTDIYENCIGFVSGLYSACCMIAASTAKEVVLITTDGGSYYANIKDRNTYPLVGDAAAVTVISKSDRKDDKIDFVFHTDGSRRDALLTPAGGLRIPYSEKTAELIRDGSGNYRSLNNLHMDGTAVFQFVMEEVPAMIDEICAYAGVEKDAVRYHLTHQPNKFMLRKLAGLLNVPSDVLFDNIVENFGNSSCATIPVNTAFNLGSRLLRERFLVCFSAFGAGLSLAAALTHIGQMDFCELIEHPGGGTVAYAGQ
jgi:3-oxoacyl-[acyl-carrier-protein] synthase-3